MTRRNPSTGSYSSRMIVADGRAITRRMHSGPVLFFRSLLVVAWLLIMIRSALAIAV